MEKFSRKKFGRITALNYKKGNPTRTKILGICVCGNKTITRQIDLEKGITRSCGCLQKEIVSKRMKIHGMTGTRIHNIWCDMMRRCYKKSSSSYHYYGERGIKVCKRWHTFINFYKWSKISKYNDTLSIERIDVNNDYKPSNCKWIPRNEQQKNTRKTITFNGETARQASLRLSNTETLVWQRVALGWDLKRAFTTKSSRKK